MQAGIPSSPVPEHAVLSLLGLAQTSSPAVDWSLTATAQGPTWTKSLTRNNISTACIAAPDNLLSSLFGDHRGTTINVVCSITGAPVTIACLDNILSGAGLAKLLSSAAAQPGDCFMLSSNPAEHSIVSVTIAKSSSPAKTIPSSSTAAAGAGTAAGGGLGGRRRSLVTPLFQDTAPTTDRKSAGLVDHQLLTLSSNTTTSATPAAAAAAAVAFAAGNGRFVSVSRRESLAPATVSTKKQGNASGFKSDSDDHHHHHHQQYHHRAGLDLAAAEAAAALAAAADDEQHLTAEQQEEEEEHEEEDIVYGRSARSNRNSNRYTSLLLDDDEDPEWGVKPRGGSGGGGSGSGKGASIGGRGRPRKKRAGAGGRRGEYAALSCVHCGTLETPRWWKDNFPCGTLCSTFIIMYIEESIYTFLSLSLSFLEICKLTN